MPSAAARRAYAGPALFSFGFRPFFLVAGLWALLAVPLWLWTHLGAGPAEFDRDWHVHEMLFGYLGAVVAGFLTTAVPNWTGRMPVIGAPLAGLVALWLAGRLSMLFAAQAPVLTAWADSAFLVVFALVIWREVLAGRNLKNLPVCMVVTLLAGANVAFHARGLAPEAAAASERAALAAIAGLIALIGGRITPSFTRNWLAQRGPGPMPAPFGWIDRLGLGLTGAALGLWTCLPLAWASGAALIAAGFGLLVRLARWRGRATCREPLVWSLHLGYAWLGAGLMLIGLSILAPEDVPRSAGTHALTAGAGGVMTLAVMTRATLGHTGRARTADRRTLAIYALVSFAAVIRILAAFWGEGQGPWLGAAGGLWSAAFGLFLVVYGPMLAGPRADGGSA